MIMKKRYFIFSLFLCILIVSFKPTYAYFNDVKSVQSKSIQSKVMDPSGLSLTTQQNNYVYFKKAEAGIKSITYTITNNTSLELKPKLALIMDNNDDFQVGFNSDATGNELVVDNLDSKQTKAITFYIKKKRSAGEDVNQKSVTLTLSAESIGGKKLDSIKQNIDVGPDLNVTGEQEINFSTTSEDILSTTWTIKGASTNHSVAIEKIATVENALSPLNSVTKKTADKGNMQETDWQQYFKVTTSGVTDNQFTITVDRTSKALSYKKLKVWITVTGTNPDGKPVSYTKSVNITPILDSSGNRTVAWPLNKQFDSQNIYFTPVYYGSNESGKARTVFPMARFYKTNNEVADINSIQPVRFSDGEGYDLQRISSLGNTYINNRGYLTYYAMIYGMNGEQYNDFGKSSTHYRVLKYNFTTNKFYDKFSSVGIGTKFDEYMNYINPEQFINTAYQVYQDTNHPTNDYWWDRNSGCTVFVTRLNVEFPYVYSYSYNDKWLSYNPQKMSQGDIVIDTYYVGK